MVELLQAASDNPHQSQYDRLKKKKKKKEYTKQPFMQQYQSYLGTTNFRPPV